MEGSPKFKAGVSRANERLSEILATSDMTMDKKSIMKARPSP